MPSRRPPASMSELPNPALSMPAARGPIGARYELLGELGRGGMARVYRARDLSTGREVALKQLTAPARAQHAQEALSLFEREYQTLSALSHPRVTRVYDFGLDPAGAFYTMELLDGGDLRERSPLPWREACELIFDVCSSLALLHSRRLVHRDVSPRNVRCTRDGHAKLIDFGAMVSMGASAQLVGTAPFVAPEALHGSALDARTDLYTLGNTLYFALTGRLAYPARDFSQLAAAWSERPEPPSRLVPDIPKPLDRLVLSLISLEPALRPRSAFEVMQRLATLADIRREEPLSVSSAYLATPNLVGRDEPLAVFRERLRHAREQGHGAAMLFSAAAGCGRSRMLAACALDARMRGACVLNAEAATAGSADFAVARALADKLLELSPAAAPRAAHDAGVFDVLFEPAAPDSAPGAPANTAEVSLRGFARAAAQRPLLQRALAKWLVQLGKKQPLVIVVDDAERVDEPSLALLATLAERARQHRIVVVASVEEPAAAGASAAFEALRTRCETLALHALAPQDSEQLLCSVFGDVPNLALVSARIHAVAAGNPRQIMLLAQHLFDRGTIQYRDGNWSLPSQLEAADLPTTGDAAFRLRVRALSPLARRLAETQALVPDGSFSHADYALLEPDAEPQAILAALDELLAGQILASDGRGYTVAHRAAADVLDEALSEAERAARHAALASLYERSGRPAFAAAQHHLLAQQSEAGLQLLLPLLRAHHDRTQLTSDAGLPVSVIGATLSRALTLACERGLPARDQHELRHWLAILSVADDEALYVRAAPEWVAQLARDSGLSAWRELAHVTDAGQRLTAALQTAARRHAETPEAERVYAPDQAIRLLVHYVAISIAIGARMLEPGILLSLPGLLEPFAPLSPLVAAVWQNAIATCESTVARQTERACARWIEVYDQLGRISGAPDPQLIQNIRYAVAYGVGNTEASMGLPSALRWAELLDAHPMQKVSAMQLRKILFLQQGDLESAERCRKQAELLALQASTRQMFTSLLLVEVAVHYAARDLTGVKHIAESIEPLAERHRGWVPIRHLAEGHYRRLRGDLEGAREAYERCLALCEPNLLDAARPSVAWPMAVAAHGDTLLQLGHAQQARTQAEVALAECKRCEIDVASHEIVRVLALAESRLGEHARAAARLDELIQKQKSMGVSGLILGASYEARAQVAIAAADRASVERFAILTAEQYRYGRGSPLGVRYQALMDEARAVGGPAVPPLSAFDASMFGNTEVGGRAAANVRISKAMSGTRDLATQSQRALSLLCEARHARGGHLYLVVDGQLNLLASLTAATPDLAIERAVKDLWARASDELEPDTAEADESTGPADQDTHWTDLHGATYQPLLLAGKVDGELLNVGVALLLPGLRSYGQSPAASMPLVAELSAFLGRALAS